MTDIQTTTSTTTPPVNPDAALMTGGPVGSNPSHGQPHPDLATSKPNTQTQTTKYEVNGKTFQSAEDMSRYVADLEKKVINQPTPQANTAMTYVSPTVTNNRELIDGKPIEDVLFENPTKVLTHLENKVQAKIDQARQQEEKVKVFWNKFYEENPDLKGKEEFIQNSVSANWQRGQNWDSLQVEDFSKVVSTYSRSQLKKLGLSNGTELPNNNAATLSSSGPTTQTPSITKAPTTFVDELGKMRNRKKA